MELQLDSLARPMLLGSRCCTTARCAILCCATKIMFSPGRWSRQGRRYYRRSRLVQPCIVFLSCFCLVVAHSLAFGSSASRATLSQTHRWGRSTLHDCRRLSKSRELQLRPTTKTAGVVMAATRGACRRTLVVIGGGAAGYFGAVQAASSTSELCVLVLEAGKLPLQKVKISGGGRCNVMHDTSKAVSLIAQGYPRGGKQLIGPFKSLFGPSDAAAWFGARGVRLKTEGDGRMFPTTDDSQTIIDCLEGAARKAAVRVITSARVTSIENRASPEATKDSSQGDDDVEPQSHFDLTFTTATPLSAAERKALGVVAVVEESTGIGGATASDPSDVAEAAGVGAGTTAGEAGGSGVAHRHGKKTLYKISCEYVLQATGSAREGHGWAKRLGHAVSAPVPSLFTLTVRDPRLEGLAGLSVQDAELKLFAEKPGGGGASSKRSDNSSNSARGDGDSAGCIVSKEEAGGDNVGAENEPNKEKKKRKKGKKQPAVTQRGPLLITHTGVSGPAALKLSAFGARVLNEGGYRGTLVVNWLTGNNPSKAFEDLQAFRARNSKKTVYAFCPIGGAGVTRALAGEPAESQPSPSSALPRRLWQSLALAAGVNAGDKWADLSKAKLSALAQQLTACDLQIVGKGSFKEEFVTCGGVALSALNMRTMESRNVPGLYFAGEVVDIDGVTGGFNFQSAWTTGWVAGSAIGARAATALAGPGAAEEEAAAVGDETRRSPDDGGGSSGGREDGTGGGDEDRRSRRRGAEEANQRRRQLG